MGSLVRCRRSEHACSGLFICGTYDSTGREAFFQATDIQNNENISYPEYSVSVVKNVRTCIETFAESDRETIARVTSNPKGNCWDLVPIDVPKGTKKLCSKARLDLDSLLLICKTFLMMSQQMFLQYFRENEGERNAAIAVSSEFGSLVATAHGS